MTNNNDRLTELFHRAQASDYARKKLAYREQRTYPQLTWADVVVMFFTGIVTTLILAFIVGAL